MDDDFVVEEGEEKEAQTEEETDEDAFMEGYADEDEVKECDECGIALKEKYVVKEYDGEEYKFCSELCAKEFKESMKTSE